MTEWMTAQQVATLTKRSISRTREALESGVLHGHQNGKGGRWLVDPACVDPWVCELDSKPACVCRTIRNTGRAA